MELNKNGKGGIKMAPLQLEACSYTSVLANVHRPLETKIVDGYVWWHCPGCGSWHLLPPEYNENFLALGGAHELGDRVASVCSKHQ
jgi:hypothetical protein